MHMENNRLFWNVSWLNSRLKKFCQVPGFIRSLLQGDLTLDNSSCIHFIIKFRSANLTRSCVLVSSGRYHKMAQNEWLKQQTFVSPNSGGWNFRIKVLADMVLGGSLSWLQMTTFLLFPHLVQREWALFSLPLLIRTYHNMKAPPSWPHLNWIASPRPHR